MSKRSPLTWTLAPERANSIASEWLGEVSTTEALYGEYDKNFLVRTGGSRRSVLKVTADASEATRSLVEFQVAILSHLANAGLETRTPVPIPSASGELWQTIQDDDGSDHLAWMLSYVDGRLLDDESNYSPALLDSIGRAVGEVDAALSSAPTQGADRELEWDLQRTLDAKPLTEHIPAGPRRDVALASFEVFESETAPALAELPRSVIHNDGGNQHNMLLAESGPPRVCGIIDFGDAVLTPTICGLGIACAYAAFGTAEPIDALSAVSRAYFDVLEREREHALLVPRLAAARLTISVSMAAKRSVTHGDDPYANVSADGAWRVLEALHRWNSVDQERFLELCDER
ncbi:MAG: phosphotransferase [Planctomycetota bacterium]